MRSIANLMNVSASSISNSITRVSYEIQIRDLREQLANAELKLTNLGYKPLKNNDIPPFDESNII